jgi:hypothetical protein
MVVRLKGFVWLLAGIDPLCFPNTIVEADLLLIDSAKAVQPALPLNETPLSTTGVDSTV